MKNPRRLALIPEPSTDTRQGPGRSATTLAPLRVMRIVAALASQPDGRSLAELVNATGIPKSSLFSLLRSLDEGGFVDMSGGLYRLGPESFALGASIARSRPFPDNLRPLLSRLHQQCGETVLISVPSDDWTEVIYVDLLESAQSLRFKVSVGSRDPLYGTALGLTMLAFAAPAIRKRYLAHVRLERLSSGTISTKAGLERVLVRARTRGFLAIPSGINENVTAIAAPVFDSAGHITAAVALAGLSSSIHLREPQLTSAIASAGHQMSRALGWSGCQDGDRRLQVP